MQFEQEITTLKSRIRRVKLTLFTGLITLSTLILSIIWQTIPNSVLFLIIIGFALLFFPINGYTTKYYDNRIEEIANQLLSQRLEKLDIYSSEKIERDITNYSNKEHIRMRGSDEKGPSFSANVNALDSNKPRVDALQNTDFDEIKSENTAAEKLFQQANTNYSTNAEDRWKHSESTDKDLIEAGVANLGDLVKTGWFEKNQKDGAVKELYKNK